MKDRRPKTEDRKTKKRNSSALRLLPSVFCPLFPVLCLLLLSVSALGEELRYHFQPGDKYFLYSDVEQRTIEIIDNNEVLTEQSTRLGNDLDILEVSENGEAFGQYTYRKAYLRLKKGTYSVTFDSDANQIRIPLDALPLGLVIGQNFYLKLAPSGHINNMKGIIALLSATKAAAPLTQTRY